MDHIDAVAEAVAEKLKAGNRRAGVKRQSERLAAASRANGKLGGKKISERVLAMEKFLSACDGSIAMADEDGHLYPYKGVRSGSNISRAVTWWKREKGADVVPYAQSRKIVVRYPDQEDPCEVIVWINLLTGEERPQVIEK